MKSNTLRALVGAAIIALLHTASVSCSNSGKQVEFEPLSLIPAPAVTEAAEGYSFCAMEQELPLILTSHPEVT
ncbi:MAG: hypothetical protein U5L72_08610 [Bacteroidales bacterium]|nr:hypothetical protein [Bacteroidales bacterium]